MLKSSLKIALFAFLCFCFIEQSYRFVAAGPKAFHPLRFNSLNLILKSGLVEESPHDDISYQLKPNLDTWFQGVRLRTNSHGMADKEYSIEKPEDVFRVAVIGSSWTMATGVEPGDAYHALLERHLAEAGHENIEFLNFAVEFYSLREIAGTARHRIKEFQPDAIVVGITTFTAYIVWDDDAPRPQIAEQTYPFFESYALRQLDSSLGLNIYDRKSGKRPTLQRGEEAQFRSQALRLMEELREIVPDRDIPIFYMWLSFGSPGKDLLATLHAKGEELDIDVVEAFRALTFDGKPVRGVQVSRFDKHPNWVGQERIAATLGNAMVAKGVLPDTLAFEKYGKQVE